MAKTKKEKEKKKKLLKLWIWSKLKLMTSNVQRQTNRDGFLTRFVEVSKNNRHI